MLIARIIMMISAFICGHYLSELAKVGQVGLAWGYRYFGHDYHTMHEHHRG